LTKTIVDAYNAQSGVAPPAAAKSAGTAATKPAGTTPAATKPATTTPAAKPASSGTKPQ
jgi:hypothetical protein